MLASVRFRLPSGVTVVAAHGDLVGRLWSAAVNIDDARVAEAHAMVSLRGAELVLISLRGTMSIDGKTRKTLVLEAGQRIELAAGVAMLVEAVEYPPSVLAVEANGIERQVLSGVASLHLEPRPRLSRGYAANAEGWLWYTGAEWRLRLAGHEVRTIGVGDTWRLSNIDFRAVAAPLHGDGNTGSPMIGAESEPLRIRFQNDTVQIQRDGRPIVAFKGPTARILRLLALTGTPVSWTWVARHLWPSDSEAELARKWGVELEKLRQRLVASHIRPELIADDGGLVQLALRREDTVDGP